MNCIYELVFNSISMCVILPSSNVCMAISTLQIIVSVETFSGVIVKLNPFSKMFMVMSPNVKSDIFEASLGLIGYIPSKVM